MPQAQTRQTPNDLHPRAARARLANRLRVLQVIPRLDIGGAERTTLEMAAAIIAGGGEALVATAGGRLEGDLINLGARVLRLPADAKNPWTLWRNVHRLRTMIRTHDIALVHARSRAPAWSAFAAARAENVPFVTTFHGIYGARTSLKRLYNSVMARGDRVIANSAYTRAHLLSEHQVPPEKVVTIPRGVEIAAIRPRASDLDEISRLRARWSRDGQDRVFLAPARLTAWKGQAFLLEVAARLRAQHVTGFRLVLVGDEQGRRAYGDELRKRAAESDLRDCILIEPASERMRITYAACDVCLAPSLKPEAFGRTVVESQAAGRPVIAAAHGAPLDTVIDQKTGWLASPGDADSWARSIRHVLELSNEALAAVGAQAARHAEENFTVAAMQEKTLGVYLDLIG